MTAETPERTSTRGTSLLTRTLAVAVLALLAGGCSLVAVDGPPPGHEEAPPGSWTCTDSEAIPSLDILMGLGHGATAVYAVQSSEMDDEALIGGLNLAAALIFLGSANRGRQDVADCQEAIRAMEARQGQEDRVELLPPPWEVTVDGDP